ncbi:hypothetical protein PPL_03083 [Heterostelium album PN500]|uniref:Uncharacterized protein n=1 Tax=Heterostelium pallidum (strain ATCC 26659 / Pp 5 / PN500) TaxID=670386 RepID=D3B3W2_HETP5|nr:hypothetical protein PPL_03083 [Heterostelium album PN500]EFA84010.1 hypothetical protein PPL_03083 [Heterostelium album PN500]|eukprot:XP_020436127.1 hypothetical protein PPL_03083 [Heterostelium album PN500]
MSFIKKHFKHHGDHGEKEQHGEHIREDTPYGDTSPTSTSTVPVSSRDQQQQQQGVGNWNQPSNNSGQQQQHPSSSSSTTWGQQQGGQQPYSSSSHSAGQQLQQQPLSTLPSLSDGGQQQQHQKSPYSSQSTSDSQQWLGGDNKGQRFQEQSGEEWPLFRWIRSDDSNIPLEQRESVVNSLKMHQVNNSKMTTMLNDNEWAEIIPAVGPRAAVRNYLQKHSSQVSQDLPYNMDKVTQGVPDPSSNIKERMFYM